MKNLNIYGTLYVFNHREYTLLWLMASSTDMIYHSGKTNGLLLYNLNQNDLGHLC